MSKTLMEAGRLPNCNDTLIRSIKFFQTVTLDNSAPTTHPCASLPHPDNKLRVVLRVVHDIIDELDAQTIAVLASNCLGDGVGLLDKRLQVCIAIQPHFGSDFTQQLAHRLQVLQDVRKLWFILGHDLCKYLLETRRPADRGPPAGIVLLRSGGQRHQEGTTVSHNETVSVGKLSRCFERAAVDHDPTALCRATWSRKVAFAIQRSYHQNRVVLVDDLTHEGLYALALQCTHARRVGSEC
mmetsp:Transcript_50363/g.133744  ORF Transcript_50363/g.133744 Transcript_50363/m.133744 type:complete len:240 (+) Transcript_50363:602-1321(+)